MSYSGRLLRPINRPAPTPKVTYTLKTRGGDNVKTRSNNQVVAQY